MTLQFFERILLGILLVIAGGIVIHTPLTLWLGAQWPEGELFIKAWKEVLMGIALLLLIISSVRRNMASKLLADRLMQLCLVFAGLHLVMMAIFQNGLQTAGAGLLIDLRFILYFVLVYGFITLFPQYRRLFIYVLAGGAAVVIGFALLQIMVLPRDFLATIGYSRATIAPYLTVDENSAFIRINSTLRGPNPLGAYAVIVIGLLAALSVRWKLKRRSWWLAGAAAVATGMTLGASYSRSSLIAAIATLVVIVLTIVASKTRTQIIAGLAVAVILVGGALYALRDSYVVSNVILHNNPTTGANVDSNAGHADSLVDGVSRMLRQPLGAGVGSTGSASLLGDQPLIIENQYLLVAHEVGWLGLAVFGWLFVEIMIRLWRRRQSALALGLFGSGIGLTIIGLLLPVWMDDTVSIVWWGLAAVGVGGLEIANSKKTKRKTGHGKRTGN